MSTILTATEVTVTYNERAILDAATLGIQEGERLGLVGRNGCGKTSLLKILTGRQAPDSGEISLRRGLRTRLARGFSLLQPPQAPACWCEAVGEGRGWWGEGRKGWKGREEGGGGREGKEREGWEVKEHLELELRSKQRKMRRGDVEGLLVLALTR